MLFGFGKVTRGLVGLIALAVILMIFNSLQIEEQATKNILTENGGLGDSLLVFQEKYEQLDKLADEDNFVAYSFKTESSKIEASFFEFREKRAFQLNVYPTEILESKESFIRFLEPYLPVESIYQDEIEQEEAFVYFYQSKKLADAINNEFSWGEKEGTFIIAISKDFQMAQLIVSRE